jgi:hypothetical protein
MSLEVFDKEDTNFIKRLYPHLIKGVIIQVSVLKDNAHMKEYEDKTGVYLTNENTLLLGDKNNIYLVYKGEEEEINSSRISENIRVIKEYIFDNNSFIYKRLEPVEVPGHLKPFIVINNTVNNTTNNFNFPTITNSVDVISFLEKNYIKGGMYPLKEMKKHSEWLPEYRHKVEVRRLTLCKSCGRRLIKDCCSEYNRENKVMLMMVVGWHVEQDLF